MGVSQVWQQRMAPAAGVDPAQQKMMMFMPVVFTFLFLWCPAGVALYWFVSNLWAIGQQYADQLHDRPAEDPPVPSGRPAERAADEAGRRRQDRRGRARRP